MIPIRRYFSPWAREDQAKVVRMLLEAGVDSDRKDLAGMTVFDWAEKNRLKKVMGILKSAGARLY